MQRFMEKGDFALVRKWFWLKMKYAFYPIPLLFRQARQRGAQSFATSDKKRKIYKNLRTVFRDQKTPDEYDEIARRHLQYLEMLQLSLIWPKIRGFASADKLKIEGLHHLDEALALKSGAILLTAHFGYGRLIKHLMRLHGYRAWLVGPKVEEKPKQKYSPFAKFVYRKVLNMPEFSVNEENDIESNLNIRPLVQKLKNNEILILTADGLRASSLFDVKVIGQIVPMATGSVSLARATGAQILPAFGVDDDEGEIGIKLVIDKPMELTITQNAKEDARANLQKFGCILESYINRYPHLYRWAKANFFKKRQQFSKVDVADRYAGNFKGKKGFTKTTN